MSIMIFVAMRCCEFPGSLRKLSPSKEKINDKISRNEDDYFSDTELRDAFDFDAREHSLTFSILAHHAPNDITSKATFTSK